MSKAKRTIEQYTYDIIECIYELKETVEKFSIDDICVLQVFLAAEVNF